MILSYFEYLSIRLTMVFYKFEYIENEKKGVKYSLFLSISSKYLIYLSIWVSNWISTQFVLILNTHLFCCMSAICAYSLEWYSTITDPQALLERPTDTSQTSKKYFQCDPRGFLKGDKLLASANVKLQPLEEKCTIHEAYDVNTIIFFYDGSNNSARPIEYEKT
jgi:hypothetical protein